MFESLLMQSKRENQPFANEPMTILAGDSSAGFYGEMASKDVILSTDLCALVNFYKGKIVVSDPGWFKFSYQGKTLFLAKRSIRQSNSGVNISKADLVNAGLVYGDKQVTIGGRKFIVRLLLGGTTDPYTASGREYQALITNIATWGGIAYSDIGIGTGEGITCAETYDRSVTLVTRGMSSVDSASAYSYLRWRPVLELVG